MKSFFESEIAAKFFFLTLALSLIVGFYFNEDLSTGGAAADFYNTLDFKFALREKLFFTINNSYQWTDEFPLHHIFLSNLFYLFSDEYWLRLFYCIISIVLPLIFYLNLKEKFDTVNKNTLFFLASLIFILPSFRYSAIWANSNITAVFFFLLSTLFFLKWIKGKNYENLNLDIILQVTFLSLAVYCRQEYAIVFIYFMIIFFQRLKLKTFITLSIIVLIFSLPGFLIYYNQYNLIKIIPDQPLLFNSLFSLNRFDDGILINSSIMSFYLIPIFFSILINFKNFFLDKKNFLGLLAIIFSFLIIYLLSNSFDYNYKVGGGFFLKLSILFFNNNLLFYFTSFLGFIFIIYLSIENRNNLILLLLLLMGFSGYHYSFQKYFEPIFLIILFLLVSSKILSEFFKNYKNLLYLYIYIFIYFMSAIVNDILQISKNI